MREVRVFLASPNDVLAERERVERVVVRLNQEFSGTAQFRVIRWEHGFYSAHRHPQELITEPADCDVVVVLFGNTLGSVPDGFAKRLPDGTPYPSGTAYELLSATQAAEENGGRPAVHVFRSTAEQRFSLSEKAELEAAEAEKARLDGFLGRWFRFPGSERLRTIRPFRDADDLAAQVDDLLRQWAGLSLRTAPAWRTDRDGSPFRGLEQFDARHSRIYFGRDRKVDRATNALLEARARERGLPFLLVVGPSGSGKSSLVRAGVVPRLTQGNLVSEVDSWRVAVMKPGAGDTPFLALAQALFVEGTPDSDPGGFGAALPELASGPYRTPAQLAEVLEEAPGSGAAPVLAALEQAGRAEKEAGGFRREVRTDLLLLVDQLEEVFAGDVTDAGRTSFARLLTAFARSGRVWLVATLRADLYQRMLDQASPFLALKDQGGFYDLASPGEAELAEILDKSAAAAGLTYGTDSDTGERLDERLLRDASAADALPLLQFSLKTLFERRSEVQTPDGPRAELTFAAYKESGGLDGAIETAAEDAVRGLPGDGAGVDRTLARLLRQMAVRVGKDGAPTASDPGLTVRAVPLAAAEADAASRTLVEALVRARLLVVHGERNEAPSVRLAHERVLSSWERARKIVEAHREYFRVRADVEQQQQRWETGRHRRELLLAAGTPLQDAERVVRDFGAELPAPLRDFVAASARRARFRQRVTATAAGTFFVLFLLASAFALLATSAEQKAARNYDAAKGAADQLVKTIAQDLRQQTGIDSRTIDIAFGAVEQLIDKMQAAVDEQDPSPMRELQAASARLRPVFGLAAGAGSDRAALDRSRANLLYEFAETYRRSANSMGKARTMAEESLRITRRLHEAGDDSPDLLAGIAKGEMTIADIDRRVLDDSKAAAPEYGKVRGHLDTALRILDPLFAGSPDRADLAGILLSQTLTRLGDLDEKGGDAEAAVRNYTRAQEVTLLVFRRTPDDPQVVGELAWSYRKLGEYKLARGDAGGALRSYANEVCVRRRLVALQPRVILRAQDLGWALQRVGAAALKLRAAGADEARDAVQEALYRRSVLVEANRTQRALYEDFARSLQQASEFHREQDNPVLGDMFARAAAELRKGAEEAFSDRLPGDQAARTMVVNQRADIRERGAHAMLGDSRFLVERTAEEFKFLQLGRVEQAAEGCWDRLVPAAEPGAAVAGRQ